MSYIKFGVWNMGNVYLFYKCLWKTNDFLLIQANSQKITHRSLYNVMKLEVIDKLFLLSKYLEIYKLSPK